MRGSCRGRTARDPIDLLEHQAETRVPELVPIRYGRMLVSPFTFYRGAALIMASDLATTPRSGLTVQCCGDAHLSNFGVFASPERRLVFDVNDFDETLPGAVGVGRQAAGGEHADRGARQRLRASRSRSASCCETVARVPHRDARVRGDAQPRGLVLAPRRGERARSSSALEFKAKRVKRRSSATLAKARTRDSMSAFSKLTEVVDGEARIVDQSAADRADRPSSREDAARRRVRGAARADPRRTARTLDVRPARPARAVRARTTWPARSSASAASARAPGSSCCSAATAATRCSCR